MTELGQTRDPVSLIPGSVSSARATATDWRQKSVETGEVATALARVNVDDAWSGSAADAFREKYSGIPTKWSDASKHLSAAANALDTFADYLEWAQAQAGVAIALWDQAVAATAAAKQQHAADIAAARTEFARAYQLPTTANAYSPEIPFVDPGDALRAQARAVLSDARGQFAAAAERSAAALNTAADAAPAEPDFWALAGEAVRLAWDYQALQAQNTLATAANSTASFFNALAQHPDILWEILGGIGLISIGTGGEAGGFALDATGVGALGGVPLNMAAAGAIGAGTTTVGHGIFRAVAAASGDSAVNPVQKQKGVDRGDRRDDYGKWTKGDGQHPHVDKETRGLDEVAENRGVDVIRTKVRADVEGGNPNGRYFDGLYRNADGTYTAIEVKSGGATRDANQRTFDAIVNGGTPARATLNGEEITIVRVLLKEVP